MFGLNLGATSSSGDVGPPPSYDTDAVTYFAAVVAAGGALSNGFKAACSDLFVAAKSNGYYSKLIQFMPVGGGVEASAEINMVSPGTKDDIYKNSPTIDSSIGVTWDGVTQWADTQIDLNTDFNSGSDWLVGAYHISGFVGTGTRNILGAMNTSASRIMLQAQNGASFDVAVYGNGHSSSFAKSGTALTDGKMIIGHRSATNKLHITVGATRTTRTQTRPTTGIAYDFAFGARNKQGVIDTFTNGKWCCKVAATGMTTAEVDLMIADIDTFIAAI